MNVFFKINCARYAVAASVLSVWHRRSMVSAIVVATVACSSMFVEQTVAQSFYQQQRQTPAKNSSASASPNVSPNTRWQPPVTAAAPPQLQPATRMVPLQPPRDIFTESLSNRAAPLVNGTSANGTFANSAPVNRLPPMQPPALPSNRFGSTTVAAQFPVLPRSRSIDPRRSALSGGSNLALPKRDSNGIFDSIDSIPDDAGPKFAQFAQANLETEALQARFSDAVNAADSSLVTAKSDLDVITAGASEKLGDVKDWFGRQTSEVLSGMNDGTWQHRLSQTFGGADLKRIFGGLAVVIGGYLGLVWLLRVINPRANGAIPREVMEVVGAVPLNNRQQLQLVRIGNKLLVMMHSAEGTQSIAEITDPAEVDYLLELCGGAGKAPRRSMPSAGVDRHRAQSAPMSAPTSAPTPSPSNETLNQLLRVLEKNQAGGHAFEA